MTTTTCVGIALADLAQHLHAVHAGQHEVEQDEVDLLALEHRQPLLAACRPTKGVCPSLRMSTVRMSWRTSSSSTIRMFMRSPRQPRSRRCIPGQLHDEAGALARPALHPQVAAVPPHDVVADREAQAGAAAVELGRVEGLEDHLQLLGRDARAAVPHPQRRPAGRAAARLDRRAEPPPVALAMASIAFSDQVGEHLLQLAVAAHHLRPALGGRRPSRPRCAACPGGRRAGPGTRRPAAPAATGFGSFWRLRANSRRLLTIRAARKVCRSTFFRIS